MDDNLPKDRKREVSIFFLFVNNEVHSHRKTNIFKKSGNREMELEEVNFTHEQLMEFTMTALNELLNHDSFLCDLPQSVTLDEVNNQIGLEYGKSITIFVMRGDGEKMPIIVSQTDGTVAHLKKGIKRFIHLRLKREKKRKLMKPKLISWRYLWKTYHLQFNDLVLDNMNSKLSELGLKNKSCVKFVKRRKEIHK